MGNEESNTYLQQLESFLGPKPQPGSRVTVLGHDIGPFGYSDQQYQSDLHSWNQAAQTYGPKLIGEKLNALSVCQFSSITGLSPESGATQNQYKNTSLTAIGQVPQYNMATQPGQSLGIS